jgi:hypothetical protein
MAWRSGQSAFFLMLLIGLQTAPFNRGSIIDCSGLDSQRSLDIDQVSAFFLSLYSFQVIKRCRQ